jgi:hypothetical protein
VRHALLLLAACGSAPEPSRPAPPPPPPTPVAQPPREPTGADVLLAVTGYGADKDDIAQADLASGYCGGTIAAIEEAKPAADKRFNCTGTSTTLAAFVPTSKTHIAITDLDHVTAQQKALTVDGVSFFASPKTYPLAAPLDWRPHLTHFIMTGVTAITRATGAACEQHGIDWLTAKIRPSFEGADYVHVSNEVSFKPDCEYVTKNTFQFCSKESDFQALLDLHTNIIELTGNHNRDYGDEPFKATYAWYQKHDIKTFGAGLDPDGANTPIIVPLADGKKLGIIGFNESCPLHECAKKPGEVGANAYDEAKAIDDIAKLKKDGADFVIVTVQFREWDNAQPTKSQTQISRTLVDHGADLVYGSQAHQLQLVEFYSGKPIFHGIGNLLFDQVHRIGVRQAFFLHHYFWHGKLVQSVPVFTFMADDRQPTLATPEQAAEMKKIVFQDDLLYR